jgi:hypothetical protein
VSYLLSELHNSEIEITFIPHHAGPLTCHPYPHVLGDKPDILGVRVDVFKSWKESDNVSKSGSYLQFPWHLVESVVEVKGKHESEKLAMQAVAFAAALRQARADKPGVYALSTRPQGYNVMWDDPVGCVSTPETSWDEPDALILYVNSLYTPAVNHHTRDPTISLCKNERSRDSVARWSIRGKQAEFTTIFVGDAYYRMSRVHSCSSKLLLWKDSFRSDGQWFKENEILKKIHEPDPVPGVVQYDPTLSGDVQTCSGQTITTPPREGDSPSHMVKTRVFMLSTGQDLAKCPTVRDALKVLYDVLEGEHNNTCSEPLRENPLLVHRFLVKHRRVLHRDVSRRNVYANPKWTDRPESMLLGMNRPKFINEILDGSKPRSER